jgi:hypothetical protein
MTKQRFEFSDSAPLSLQGPRSSFDDLPRGHNPRLGKMPQTTCANSKRAKGPFTSSKRVTIPLQHAIWRGVLQVGEAIAVDNHCQIGAQMIFPTHFKDGTQPIPGTAIRNPNISIIAQSDLRRDGVFRCEYYCRLLQANRTSWAISL